MRKEIFIHPDFFEAVEHVRSCLQDIIDDKPSKITVSPIIYSYITTFDDYEEFPEQTIDDKIFKGRLCGIDVFVTLEKNNEEFVDF